MIFLVFPFAGLCTRTERLPGVSSVYTDKQLSALSNEQVTIFKWTAMVLCGEELQRFTPREQRILVQH